MRRVLIPILSLMCIAMYATASLAANADTYTVNLAVDADPITLDPHMQLSGATLEYSHTAFDPLLRWTQDMKHEGRLATKWERLNKLTMRFWLRKGVKFHSGNTFTAKDVAWTVKRLQRSVDFKGIFEPIVEVKIINDYAFDIITKEPYPLLANTATYIFPMDSAFYTGTDETGQAKDIIKKSGPSFALMNESGTGPFKVTYREQGVKTVYERFPDYWDTKSPGNVQKIILTPIKNNATRVASLLSGDTDFIYPVSPQDFDLVNKNNSTKLVTLPGTRVITLQINQSRRPEFKDVRVRQAMVHAINNAGIVKKIMKGFGTAAAQQGPKGYLGYKEELQPRYDLKKAKALMKEAGYEKGFECSMIAPNNRYVNDAKIAEAAANMLAKIGIKVNLKTMPKAQYWDEFDAKVADIQMIGWHSDTEDSGNFNEYLTMCVNTDTGYGQYNSGTYCNPRVDELTLACQAETDMAKRTAMLQEIEQILYDDAAFIPLHWQNLAWGASKNVAIESIVNVMNFPYVGDLVVK